MIGYSAHKRFACDRCRDQKLRCPREDNSGDGPCARCSRAGALCVTSGARPLGRPRTNQASATAASATAAAAGAASDRSHARRRERERDHNRERKRERESAAASASASAAAAASASASWRSPLSFNSMPASTRASAAPGLPWPTGAMSVDEYYASLVPGPGPNIGTAGSPNPTTASLDSIEHLFGMLVPDGDLAGYSPIGANTMMPDGDTGFAADLDADAMGRPSGSLPDADHHSQGHRQLPVSGAVPSNTPALAATDALISLSRLNESLSRQLSRITSYPWQAPHLMQGVCSAKMNSIAENPVAEALQSTASFVGILGRLSPWDGGQSPGAWSASDSGISMMDSNSHPGGGSSNGTGCAPNTARPLSTTTYLLLLSSYLQLMQLYNIMFRRVAEFLGDMSEEAISDFQPQPEFRVAGLPVIPSRLYIKVLVQVIDHQLESVERLMGLSSEYRISGRSAPRGGIFSDKDVSGLLQTVMGQPEDCSRPGSTVTGKSLVVSLRESMGKVQELLRG